MRVDPSTVIPTSEDTPESWIVFHKALKSWFGKKSANAYFVKFWNQRAGAGSTADTHDLREYMEEQGVDLTTNFKGEITDFGAGILDWFKDTVNVLRAIIFGAIIIAIGLIAYYVIKSTNKGKSAKEIVLDAPIPATGLKGSKAIGAVTPALSGQNTLKLLE